MTAPSPLSGTNPFTGMYQARQFFIGDPNTPIGTRRVFDSLVSPPTAGVTAEGQTPLVEEAEFFGLYTQTITPTGSPTSGGFILGYDGIPTAFIPLNATGATVTTALGAISALPAPTGSATNAQQTLTINNTPTSAALILQIAGFTVDFAWTSASTAAQLQTALQAVLGSANVTVAGSAGGPYTITYQGIYAAAAQSTLTTTGTTFVGGSSPTAVGASTVSGVAPTYPITVTGSAGGPWTATLAGALADTPVQLIAVRQLELVGGTLPNIVVTSTAEQEGFVPF